MSPPRVRITSRCSTPDEFVAVYRQYCDERSIFIATKTPKPRGTTLRFAVTLSNGQPQIVGIGRIAESHPDADNPYKRPGMRIEFIDLEDNSRQLVHRLHSARRLAAAPPPPLPPGVVRAIPVAVPPPAPAFDDDEATDVRANPAGEDLDDPDRTEGSDLVLPANPFGAVPDESLEGFVECTLYEEDGAEVLPPEEEVERQLKWLAPGAVGTPAPTLIGNREDSSKNPVESALERVESAIERVRRQTIPPSYETPVDSETDEISPRHRRPTATISPPMPVDERAQWKLLLIACGVTAALALVAGYFIWGGSPATLVVNAAPVPPSADPDKATGSAAAGEPKSGDLAAAPGTDVSKEKTDESEKNAVEPEEKTDDPAQPDAISAPDMPAGTDEPAKNDDKIANVEADTEPAPNTGAPAGTCNATIHTQPTGATVRLDGAVLGVTPLETGVPCGSGLLKLVRPRYESIEKRVELADGTTELKIRMSRPIHSLTVTSFPAGAKATVNGRSIGKTPARTRVKGYERARIKIRKRGYDSVSKSVYMRRKSSRVHSKLRRQGSTGRSTRTSTRPAKTKIPRKTSENTAPTKAP